MKVRIKRIHPDAVIPQYARNGDAGFDLVAIEDVIVRPGETGKVPTGLAFEIPIGYEMQVRPRSGVSAKTKLRVSNAPGTVDSGYRGEVCVLVDNLRGYSMYVDECPLTISGEFTTLAEGHMLGTYLIRKGDRIAQAIIAPVIHAEFAEVDELSETDRGDGGFGSSGFSAEVRE